MIKIGSQLEENLLVGEDNFQDFHFQGHCGKVKACCQTQLLYWGYNHFTNHLLTGTKLIDETILSKHAVNRTESSLLWI